MYIEHEYIIKLSHMTCDFDREPVLRDDVERLMPNCQCKTAYWVPMMRLCK